MLVSILFVVVAATNFTSDFVIREYGHCDEEYVAFVALHGNRSATPLSRSTSLQIDRRQMFCENLKNIIAHNELARSGKSSYSQGINQFCDLTDEELSVYSIKLTPQVNGTRLMDLFLVTRQQM
jgi:hypothetical protein